MYEDGYYINSTEIEKSAKPKVLEYINAYLCVHFFFYQSRKTYLWKIPLSTLCIFFFLN